jgi:hypothetical protein
VSGISLAKLGADELCLPGSKRTLRADIYSMKDADLVRALTKVLARPITSIPLSDWERGFCDGAARAWAKYGGLTWKQRKEARYLLIRVLAPAIRASIVHQWFSEEVDDPESYVDDEPSGGPL